jgi:toluene monooxygenase system ferredoxin subunit
VAVWRYAGSLDDIWAGEMTAVNLGAADVLLCNLDGTLVAYEDRCRTWPVRFPRVPSTAAS